MRGERIEGKKRYNKRRKMTIEKHAFISSCSSTSLRDLNPSFRPNNIYSPNFSNNNGYVAAGFQNQMQLNDSNFLFDGSVTNIIASSSSIDKETAAALILPLLSYKVSAYLRGQRLQWYLDASIALAVVAFLMKITRS